MTNPSTSINSKSQKQNKVKQDRGDNQLAGTPLFITSHKPSNQNLDGFKPWFELNYRGFLFSFDQDSQPGFELTVFIPWFYLVSQGLLFTTE
ncbi:hypothetical protein ES705_36282 [subsurface metagenome]